MHGWTPPDFSTSLDGLAAASFVVVDLPSTRTGSKLHTGAGVTVRDSAADHQLRGLNGRVVGGPWPEPDGQLLYQVWFDRLGNGRRLSPDELDRSVAAAPVPEIVTPGPSVRQRVIERGIVVSVVQRNHAGGRLNAAHSPDDPGR